MFPYFWINCITQTVILTYFMKREYHKTRLHPQGKGGPFRDSCVEDVWRQSDVDYDFHSAKSWTFLFLHCVYGPNCEKFRFFGHIHFAKRFLFFLQKNLMWSRLQGIKSRFGFSTFHFLKFCLSIWTQKSCYARCTPSMICRKSRTDVRVRTRTDGHRFLNVCHTRAPKGAINIFLSIKIKKILSLGPQ